MRFIIYDKDTGEILGCMMVSDPLQAENYPDRLEVGKEITMKDFESQPEIFYKVDVTGKKLVKKNDLGV